MSLPMWLFNKSSYAGADVSLCTWTAAAIDVVPPVLVPWEIKDYGAVLEQRHALEAVPRAALRAGMFLAMKDLKKVCISNAVPTPGGSGKTNPKNGKQSIIKPDWANALIKHLFPDVGDSEHTRMVDAIMGRYKYKACSATVIAACKVLDEDERSVFDGLKKSAEKEKQMDEEARKKRRLAVA
jgi:hypothetical protein